MFLITYSSPAAVLLLVKCVLLQSTLPAFGSIPHASVLRAFEKSGAGPKLTNILASLLLDASTLVCSAAGGTGPIPIHKGIRQGDPLSGIMFNFVFNPIIVAIFNLLGIKILVFADDIMIIANSPTKLQEALDIFSVMCSQLNLSINPNKCFTMHALPCLA